VRGFSVGVALLAAIYRLHPKELEWEPHFDTLAGGPWLREKILSGAAASAIAAEVAPSLAAFDASRPKRYPTMAQLLKA
jgi:hypothetical protein